MCNKESQKSADMNKGMLTGRARGKFLFEGNARGGGHRWPTIVVEKRVFVPEPLSDEEIFGRTCGTLEGTWTPYEERTAAVKEVARTETREYSPNGVIIKNIDN